MAKRRQRDEICGDDQAAVIDGTTGRPVAPTRKVRVRLKTVDDVANELASIYRAVKAGRIDRQLGNSLVYTLQAAHKVLADRELLESLATVREQYARHGLIEVLSAPGGALASTVPQPGAVPAAGGDDD